jgi:hypothetical protein
MIKLGVLICLTILGQAPLVEGGDVSLVDATRPHLSAGSADRTNLESLSVNDPHLQTLVQWALDDAARRTPLETSVLNAVLAERVTWPDGALGCRQPGMSYPQALVSGYRIHVVAGSETLHYHAGNQGQPFFCPAARVSPPATDPRT